MVVRGGEKPEWLKVGNISQRITLEGIEDVQRKLQALGQSGEHAFKQIKGGG